MNDALAKAFVAPVDALTVFSMHTVYDCVESCTDEREHAGDCIETVIMKNT